MKFRELPRPLRAYILAHFVVLIPLAHQLLQLDGPKNWIVVLAMLVATTVFSTWRVELTVFQGRMTVANAAVCLALLLEGPHAATMCALLGALVATLLMVEEGSRRVSLRRPHWYRVFFNMANGTIACAAGALVFDGILRLVPSNGMATVLSLVAFTGTYFLINTLGVSLACAYQQNLRWLDVWQQNFLWTAPGFFASASIAAGIVIGFQQVGVWSLLFVPPIWLIFRSYQLYMERLHLYSDKMKQDMTHIQELNRLNQAIIASLATAIDAKDRYTCSHINRVQHYAIRLAQTAGLSGPDLEAVSTGALVHDIGKLGIPDHILGKPGKLTQEEFSRIQAHVSIGAEILSPIPFPFPVVDVVLTHHERWDGLGYPRGLRGDDIPIGGRIISLVDVFDALTSNRPYRRAMTVEQALQTLRENAGKQFDPKLVHLFEKILPEALEEIALMEADAQSAGEDAAPQETFSALSQISQAAAEMAAVCDVAHSLAEQENSEDVSRVVVQRALSLLPADTAVLYAASELVDGLTAVAVEGKYRDKLIGMEIRMGEGVAGCVAETQQARVNAPAAPDVARRFTIDETMELSAATAVPLVHGPEILGVLAVYTMGYSVLSDHHLRVLNILAEHAAGAIQNLRRQEHQRELAYVDPLTGLANSRGLVRHLDRMLHGGSRNGEQQVSSVVMLDIDRFKQVNDTLGHLRGDELLRQIGQTLTEISRPGDIPCRYAGDEFVLLLPNADRKTAERVATRLRKAIDTIPAVEGKVQIGASVGVATFPEDGTDGKTLMNVADERMYTDKFRRKQHVVDLDQVLEPRRPELATR